MIDSFILYHLRLSYIVNCAFIPSDLWCIQPHHKPHKKKSVTSWTHTVSPVSLPPSPVPVSSFFHSASTATAVRTYSTTQELLLSRLLSYRCIKLIILSIFFSFYWVLSATSSCVSPGTPSAPLTLPLPKNVGIAPVSDAAWLPTKLLKTFQQPCGKTSVFSKTWNCGMIHQSPPSYTIRSSLLSASSTTTFLMEKTWCDILCQYVYNVNSFKRKKS